MVLPHENFGRGPKLKLGLNHPRPMVPFVGDPFFRPKRPFFSSKKSLFCPFSAKVKRNLFTIVNCTLSHYFLKVPPSAALHSRHLLSKLSTKLLIIDIGKAFHSSTTNLISSSLFNGPLLPTFVWRIPHRSSIGLRSGLRGGQSFSRKEIAF